MTTLVGIKSNYGDDSIVFGADVQMGYYDENGNITGSRAIRKISYGNDWMLAHTGSIDRSYLDFQQWVEGKKRGVSKTAVTNAMMEAVANFSKGAHYKGDHFSEVINLNKLSTRNGVECDDLHEFILAVSRPNLQLFKVDYYGNISEYNKDNDFEYITMGAGSDSVEEGFRGLLRRKEVDASKINTVTAIDLMVAGLDAAQTDDGTAGLDIVVMTEQGIEPYGRMIHTAMLEARKSELEMIKKKYRNNED